MPDEPHSYQSRHSTYPFATRGLFPGYSPGSNSSIEVPGPFAFERAQIPAAPASVVSAPASRSTFQQQNGQAAQSWNLWGAGSQKEVALRRFRSATPTVGGGQPTASPGARTAPMPQGPRTPDDSFRPEAYRHTPPTSHLGLYVSPQSNPGGRLVGDVQAPVQTGYLTSPATVLSASPLQGPLGADDPGVSSSSISPDHGVESHLPTDTYTVPTHPPTSGLTSDAAANTLPGLPDMDPNANFNPLDMRVPVQSTNVVHSYPNGSPYTYTTNYSTYSSYAV